MGNKFSNRTGTLLRPKVCKSPPPPAHPTGPPNIPLPCCGQGIPQILKATLNNCQCTVLNGQTAPFIYNNNTQNWTLTQYQINGTGSPTNFQLKIKCVGSTINLELDWQSQSGHSGSETTAVGTPTCSPFSGTIRWSWNTHDTPSPCTNANKQMDWTFSPA